MPPVGGYRSKLLNRIVSVSSQVVDRGAEALRHLKVAASWSVRVLGYTLAAALRFDRAGMQMGGQPESSKPDLPPATSTATESEARESDAPLARVLQVATELVRSASKEQKQQDSEERKQTAGPWQKLTGALQRVGDRAIDALRGWRQKSNDFPAETSHQNSTADSDRAELVPTPDGNAVLDRNVAISDSASLAASAGPEEDSLRTSGPDVRGVASLRSNRRLVLIGSNNEVLDILTPAQRALLHERILWEIYRAYGLFWPFFLAAEPKGSKSLGSQPRDRKALHPKNAYGRAIAGFVRRLPAKPRAFLQGLLPEASSSEELQERARLEEGQRAPAGTNWQRRLWEQLEALNRKAIALFDRKEFPPREPTTFEASETATGEPEEPWLTEERVFGNPGVSYAIERQTTASLAAPPPETDVSIVAPKAKSKRKRRRDRKRQARQKEQRQGAIVTPPPNESLDASDVALDPAPNVAIEPVPDVGVASHVVPVASDGISDRSVSDKMGATSDFASEEPDDTWIETDYTAEYVKHPFERVLEWVDRAMFWLENKLPSIWRWLKKRLGLGISR